jgi:hypothetical protein
MTLPAGEVHLRYSAIVEDDGRVDDIDEQAPEHAPADLPDAALQYLLPSRYRQSDEVAPFAFEQFGTIPSGYLPDIGVPDPGVPMDFCAWMEVWLGDRWYTFDPHNDQHRIGRTVAEEVS